MKAHPALFEGEGEGRGKGGAKKLRTLSRGFDLRSFAMFIIIAQCSKSVYIEFALECEN